PHRADPLLGHALLHVPVEAPAGEVAQAVRADSLLAARSEGHHVGFAQALAGVLVERARHLRADRRHHLPVRIEEPGDDGSGVAGSFGLPYSCRPWWAAIRCVTRHSSSRGNPGMRAAFSRTSWQVRMRWPTSLPSSVYSNPGSGEISRALPKSCKRHPAVTRS